MTTTQDVQDRNEDVVQREAEMIDALLRSIQHALRYAIEVDKGLVPLTAPQVQVLTQLARSGQEQGPTLKALSASVGLSHSTVSGIVDRLARQGLVRRVTNPDDRRASHIELTEQVTEYLQQSLPSRRLYPLLAALQHASDEERHTIIAGLITLQRRLALSKDEQHA